jgi:RNA polymerase sigma-70 factor (ECF subfamily)
VNEEAVSDAQLLEAVTSGAPGAFDSFVERYGRRILAFGTRMCGHREDAEDVLQDTLLTAYQGLRKLRDPGAVRTWLFRVASNQCLMRRRKTGPTREVSLDQHESAFDWLSQAGEIADWSKRPDDPAVRAELSNALEGAIRELPREHRIVLLLRDVEGLSTRETAETLAIGQPAVKMRLHRARLALRERLTGFFSTGPSTGAGS